MITICMYSSKTYWINTEKNKSCCKFICSHFENKYLALCFCFSLSMDLLHCKCLLNPAIGNLRLCKMVNSDNKDAFRYSPYSNTPNSTPCTHACCYLLLILIPWTLVLCSSTWQPWQPCIRVHNNGADVRHLKGIEVYICSISKQVGTHGCKQTKTKYVQQLVKDHINPNPTELTFSKLCFSFGVL